MALLHIPMALVNSSHQYQMALNGGVPVSEVARYLAIQEDRLEASTLEIARPLLPQERLGEVGLQSGDRLLVFTQPTRLLELPQAPRPGDKIVRFKIGERETSSRGKKSLTVGKAEAGFVPDLDLGSFITSGLLAGVNGVCLWLDFDDYSQVWYAAQPNGLRVMVDDLEIGAARVALNADQWLRFYRADSGARLGEVRVMVEAAQWSDDAPQLPKGAYNPKISVGLENSGQSLNASDAVRVEQVIEGMARAMGLASDVVQVYAARLLAPQTRVEALPPDDDGFLYTALNLRLARAVMLLRDMHDSQRVYALPGQQEGDEIRLGCRTRREVPDADLDIDLYEAVVREAGDPRPFQGMSPYFARIVYQEGNWWVRLDERSQVPLFVNQDRARAGGLLPLQVGNVLTFGPALDRYYARLVVEEGS